MESSPLRAIPLLSISSPCQGILFYRYRERARGRLVIGIEDLKKAGLWLWLMIYTCIVTLVTIWYIVGFMVSMYYEYRVWAQVAVLLM